MSEAILKALATITEPDSANTDDAPYGGFTAVLSTSRRDREDDELQPDEWLPLPKSITIDIDHMMSVEGTVGSGKPYFDDSGRLMLDARFANTDKAQQVRSLVKDGHINAVSVAFLNRKTEKDSRPQRELLNAGIVAVPANPDAVITSSKALSAVDAYRKAASDDKPKPPYGANVTYADPGYLDRSGKPAKDGNGLPRYPVNNPSRTRAAWSYINMPKNSSQYSAEQLGHIKDKIKAAADKFGIKIDDSDDQKAFDRVVGLVGAGLTFAESCKALDLGEVEPIEFMPDAVEQAKQMVLTPNEVRSLMGYDTSVGDLLAASAIGAKAGARNNASDTKLLQAIHDASSLLGARCASEAAPDEGDGSDEGANKSHAGSVTVTLVPRLEIDRAAMLARLKELGEEFSTEFTLTAARHPDTPYDVPGKTGDVLPDLSTFEKKLDQVIAMKTSGGTDDGVAEKPQDESPAEGASVDEAASVKAAPENSSGPADDDEPADKTDDADAADKDDADKEDKEDDEDEKKALMASLRARIFAANLRSGELAA